MSVSSSARHLFRGVFEHEGIQLLQRDFTLLKVGHDLAPVDDHETVSDLIHVGNGVGDVHTGPPGFLDLASEVEHLLHFFEALAQFMAILLLSGFRSRDKDFESELNKLHTILEKQN